MKRIILSLLTILVAISAYAQVSDCFQDILPVTDRKMMKSLNGQWSLKVVKGISEDAAVPTEDGTWGKIPVPGCWEPNGFCKPKYPPVSLRSTAPFTQGGLIMR